MLHFRPRLSAPFFWLGLAWLRFGLGLGFAFAFAFAFGFAFGFGFGFGFGFQPLT
ncbi:hypothetical protein J2X52_003389 [Luteimonas sp. 3794]|nr:hypothetical protein [Luteimonas sp. 3794]